MSLIAALTAPWTWNMAWRETRRNRRRLLLYSSSIVLGVAALVAVGSFAGNLREAIEAQAKTLLGADLALSSNTPFSEQHNAFFNSLGGAQARETSFSSMVYFPRLAQARLAQIRALEGDFPFYGTMETVPAAAAVEFRTGRTALVEETIMKQFELVRGDTIKIGDTAFEIVGSLRKVPGEMAGFAALAPRVYITSKNLPGTGLLQKGSLVRYKAYFKFAPAAKVPQLVRRVRPMLGKLHLQADTVEHRKRELGRATTNVYHFLNLVGFVALILGGIGISSSVHVYVKQKLPAVAVLRSLGCTSRQAMAVYLVQGFSLGAFGVLAGTIAGLAVQMIVPAFFANVLPVKLRAAVSWSGVALASSIGMVICLLFTLLPLLPVRRVPPLAVLRASIEFPRGRKDPLLWTCYFLLAAALVSFSISQTQTWRLGAGVAAGVGIAFLILAGLAKGLLVVFREQARRAGPFAWRQGLASLYRPGNRTLLVMLSLGLGTFLILSMYLVQSNLVRSLFPATAGAEPDAVLFDIQSDQKQGVIELLKAQQLPVLQQVPVVTMRLAEIKGRTVEQIRKDPRRTTPNWALRREYRSTYRDRLVDSEKGLAGTWPPVRTASGKPVPVSVEDGIAKSLQISLGDELLFDVQGVPITTVVAHLREVDWRRLQPNFFFVFPTGVLEEAPSFHVLVTKVGSGDRSARLQRELVQRLPNVSVIDLRLVLQTIDAILSKISFVVRFMALFTVGTGLVVLTASLITGRYQRLQESILLRTLGASRVQVLAVHLVEYLCLGILAAVTGLILAAAASWALSVFVFKVEFSLSPVPLLVTAAIVPALTMGIGLLTSRGICSHPPLEVLRSEG